MTKNEITEIVSMTESMLNLKRGDITWGIKGSKLHDEKYMCGYFSYKGHEFANILAPISDSAINDSDMIGHILYMEEEIMEQIPKVIGTYGLLALLQNVGMKGMKFMFVANMEPEELPKISVDLSNIQLN